jgi:type IV pilus assembly protein PilM
MAKSGGPTVGLDIGSKVIKVAEVVPAKNGVAVKAVGMAPTPPGAMENDVIVDAKLLGDAVKKLLKESGIQSRRSVSSVSGQGTVVVRVIEVPKMSDTELSEQMRWEVERHVPFAANEVIMDFQPIQRADTPPDAQTMEILLAVAQQDMIDRHVEMLFAAGLTPVAIDVEPLAASRCLIELGPDPYGKKSVAIVNLGASNTDLGIYRDGLLSFPRTFPLAGDMLTRAIMQQLGVDEETAESMKLQYGEVILDNVGQQPQPQAIQDDAFLDFSVGAPIGGGGEAFDLGDAAAGASEPTGGFDLGVEQPAAQVPAPVEHDPNKLQVFAAIAPVLGEILSEVRRSLEYYQGKTSDGRVDEILLCGGSSALKGLDKFLEAELGVPTRVADPLQYAPLASRTLSHDQVAQIAPSLAVAIGLGARDLVSVPTPVASGGRKRGKK